MLDHKKSHSRRTAFVMNHGEDNSLMSWCESGETRVRSVGGQIRMADKFRGLIHPPHYEDELIMVFTKLLPYLEDEFQVIAFPGTFAGCLAKRNGEDVWIEFEVKTKEESFGQIVQCLIEFCKQNARGKRSIEESLSSGILTLHEWCCRFFLFQDYVTSLRVPLLQDRCFPHKFAIFRPMQRSKVSPIHGLTSITLMLLVGWWLRSLAPLLALFSLLA